jgi:hypothetical protein
MKLVLHHAAMEACWQKMHQGGNSACPAVLHGEVHVHGLRRLQTEDKSHE